MEKEHFEILLEHMASNLQVVMEAFSSLNDKVDTKTAELTEQFQGLDNRLIRVEAKLVAVDTSLAEVKSGLNDHRSSTELHQAPKKRPLKRV